MSLTPICATQVMLELDAFDDIIDARSEDEYQLDHLPGAHNWPTLNNDERREIGTLYKQVNPFEARKRGAVMAARNIAAHIEQQALDKPKNWRPLIYCWRGGQRSGALSLILSQIGFKVTLIEGGYKAFRHALVQSMDAIAPTLSLQVICGPTGSGKTRLLSALARRGAQVIDLEALANHRSSVLGALPGLAQPCQKRFETLLWDCMRAFDPLRPVFIESESKKVGNLSVPAKLVEQMRSSPCLDLQLPDDERVELLLEDYAYLTRDVDYFCDRLAALTALKGRIVVQAWQQQARHGQFAAVVRDLLLAHYDPAYLQSMQRNFLGFRNARPLRPDNRSALAMDELAEKLLAELPTGATA